VLLKSVKMSSGAMLAMKGKGADVEPEVDETKLVPLVIHFYK